MADEKKIVTQDILEKAISDVLQIVVDNVYEEEEYDEDSINALFDADKQTIDYYSSLISDSLVSENRIFSSKHVTELVQQAVLDSNAYSDGLITNISSIELKYTDALPATGNANTIYILKSTTSDPDTLNLYNDGAWIKIGDFNINLDDYATVNYVDTKLADKANSSEVLAVNKVQTTTGSETNDTVYSSKLTKDELDKKANDDEVVKKTDISTTINSTSTNDKVAGAKAVHDSLANKLDKTVILTTADEVNSFDREYQSFIIEPTVAEAVGLPKAPDSTWFCINLSHFKGFKYPSQIAFEYAGIERVMYRTAHNGVWHDWKKLCITSVADVPMTLITISDETNYKSNINSKLRYTISNGICYVTGGVDCVSPISEVTVCTNMPKSYMEVYARGLNINGVDDNDNAKIYINGTNLQIRRGVAGNSYRFTFSYPVAE